ncbi:MAG TPA: NTP transferase domain-containing protein [Acidimicrobiales bacterium]|nr:NTP transferase domain-containing protein [Acidimicrobiales bacterium]
MAEQGTTGGQKLTLVILAAGQAKRYGGCKPLAPVGPRGEAVIDLVASDALASGFDTVVLVLNPSTGPAIRYHVEHTWPGAVDVRFVTQPAPVGTVNAVLCASEHVADSSYAVGNADDVYGRAACAQLAEHLRTRSDENALVGYRLADAVVGFSPVTRGICTVGDDGRLLGVDERRQVQATREGSFVTGDGLEPATLAPDSRVSMNLWGFTPAFNTVLRQAMAAAADASEEAEVLLPEVVGRSLATNRFTVLPARGRCVGVTHPDDLSLVQDELNRQVGAGERPAGVWSFSG